jgi:hypothetical protein
MERNTTTRRQKVMPIPLKFRHKNGTDASMLERDAPGVNLAVTSDDVKWNVVNRSKQVGRMRGSRPLIRQ